MIQLRKKNFNTTILFIGVVLLSLTACKKYKTRKAIEGTWTYLYSTIDGVPDERTVSGTYTFLDCYGIVNTMGLCNVDQDLRIEYMGEVSYIGSTLGYKVLKQGKRILLDGTEMELDMFDDMLTLTSNEDGSTVIVTLQK